jgi:hypothetical protein
MVDAICTSLCLEAASPDVPSYAKALKNVVSLLKPGGMLIQRYKCTMNNSISYIVAVSLIGGGITDLPQVTVTNH